MYRMPEMQLLGVVPLTIMVGVRVLDDTAHTPDEPSRFAVYYSNGASHVFRTPNFECAKGWATSIATNKTLLDPDWIAPCSPGDVEAQRKQVDAPLDRKVDEDAVRKLVSLEFTRADATRALGVTGSDPLKAIRMLCLEQLRSIDDDDQVGEQEEVNQDATVAGSRTEQAESKGGVAVSVRPSSVPSTAPLTSQVRFSNTPPASSSALSPSRPKRSRTPGASPAGARRTSRNSIISRGVLPSDSLFCFSGYLQVCTASRAWERRWFYLENSRLAWCVGSALKAGGVYELEPVSEIKIVDRRGGVFSVNLVRSSVTFSAGSYEAMNGWIEALVRARGMRPWRPMGVGFNGVRERLAEIGSEIRPQINHSKVPRNARPGDLLLFSSRGNIMSGLTRKLTSSRWDHIALFVKTKTNRLGVMEALANGGVQISSFRAFFDNEWYKQYSLVAMRRLVGPREIWKKEKNEVLARFVAKTTGKKYSVKAFQMLKAWTTGRARAAEGVVYEKDKKSFCCSELVAAAYKELGFLRPDIDAVAYVPGTFGADRDLMLMGGFRLGYEIQINFNR